MDRITKFILKYYFSIKLVLGILGICLIGLLVFQIHSLIELQNQPVLQRKFHIVKKPLPVISQEKTDFKIFPGDTIETIAARLEEKDILSKDIFLSYLRQDKVTIDNLLYYKNNKEYIFEGFFFSDTYSIPVISPPEEICKIFIQPYLHWMREEYDHQNQIELTPEEVVSVASIIQKEAGLDEDRPMIAGVIYNRLNKNMRLQIDATVLYALGEHKVHITKEDLKISSPYNTYQIEGLPAGPICTPSYESLYAALHPQNHPYYFYVVQTYGKLKHVFSATYEEHLENVSKYRNSIK